MKTEQVAVLLCLADTARSDVALLEGRLARMQESEVAGLLSEVTARVGGHQLAGDSGLDLRTLLSEVTPARMGKRLDLLEEYRKLGVDVITLWDNRYPPRLREIATPPLVLMVHGTDFPGDNPVAIVGTRQPSEAGQTAAFVYAIHLARKGFTIVSGLARGIDTRAHLGALSVGGKTVAILPGHLGKVYPPENRDLFGKIQGAGALVSEVTQYATFHRGRFIERNRITSGLSEATVIAEFHGSGGTFQQGKFALSQGRPLFIVDLGEKGGQRASAGMKQLVQMGARAVSSPDELIDAVQAGTIPAPRYAPPKPSVQSTLDGM